MADGGGVARDGVDVSVAARRGLPAVACLLLAGGAFAVALFLNYGYYAAFGLVALGVVALVTGAFLLQRAAGPRLHPVVMAGAFVAWLAVAVALAASDLPWSYFVPRAPHETQPAIARGLLLVGLALVAAGTVRDHRLLSLARVAAFGVAVVVGAHWTIGQSPEPTIDVWHMHQEASDRLTQLENPYAPEIDYYGRSIDFYGYPPVTLLVQAPFHAAFGDVRYASVAGLLVAGWAARAMAHRAGLPRYAADAAGALLVVMGRPYYMVEQAWTEPVVAGLAGVAALAWATRSRWTAPLAALAMASKQFLWPFVPLLVRVPGLDRRALVTATVVLVAVFLPFFAWGPERFWQGLVATHVSGEAVSAAYPGVPPGDPWPGSATLAIHLQQYGIGWPLWIGTVLWVAVAAAFAVGRDRGLGTMLVSAAAAVACVSFFGAAFHPNYIWLMPALVVLGVLADRARAALPVGPVGGSRSGPPPRGAATAGEAPGAPTRTGDAGGKA